MANIAAKFNGKVNISPVTSQSNMAASDCVDSTGVSSELKSVKIKNDHLILEKHSLKSKNEELNSENRELRFFIIFVINYNFHTLNKTIFCIS